MDATTEPTMDPNDSPLCNLDLWCDWSGVPEDPVSITIAMELEACGHPNLHIPILNVKSPNIVKSPSWIIRLKPDFAHNDTDAPLDHEYGDETKRYPAKNGSISTSGSVVLHDDSQGNHFRGRRTVNISAMYTRVDSSDSSTSHNPCKNDVNGSSPNSNPRKRSATAASLPDSIPPDDECQGIRHKVLMTKVDPPRLEPVSQDTSATKEIASSIPIRKCSVSLDGISVTSGNIPLPPDSAPTPVPVSPNVTPENPLDGNIATVENLLDEIFPCRNAETSSSKTDLSGTEPLTEANLLQRNYDTFSTRGRNGSLSSSENSDKEKEDLLLSLESIGSPSSFSGHGFNQPPLSQTSAEIANKHKPKLVLNNDILYLQTPQIVYSATYQIAISLKVRLQKGKSRDWWELIVSGLPRLAQFESGYLYFRTPPGQGMEFTTSPFKRHTLVESCLMAQFGSGKNFVIPFRKCNAEYYGQLKDHKVNTVIRAEVAETGDPSSYLIKYNAVCSIDLINHSFWAEKCKFYLRVHGGPEGEFDAVFAAEKPLINSIRLQPAPDGIGISRISIISIPQALSMFTVSWEVKVSRGDVTWLPWIRTTLSYSDIETNLQEDYTLFGPKAEHIPPKHPRFDTRCQSPSSQLRLSRKLDHFKPPVAKTPASFFYDSFAIRETGIFKPASKSTSTQTLVAETPVAEPKKRPLRAVRGLWTLIKFFVQLLGFLASVHIIYYWSYLMRDCGFRFDSFDSFGLLAHQTSYPQNEVYGCSNGLVDYAVNITNADVEKEMDTVLPELLLQPELIRSEVQQTINTAPVEITPMPLRDRIDYLLGWRGPIA
ncbi:uncharacterized protein N7479_002260 [Penicillium vulpinum]|uniref:Uncharacterized protein n=1 Tax=Penicillium vulpinum TaxID=29845 RepID=A0A1V6S7R7_9EURO|nr:uncharacterized protein N7479_002260 [Penicillium vulpinum]KAJ5972342.1 hypothetical protein N7479_002260 [Penicillium vulpinum]OQE09896.1 hypothetical protein PENVUL_c005G06006 [Penicillium vulpinum]